MAGQVDTGAERVSSGAQALAQGTTEQAATVYGLMTNVAAITAQVRDSTVRCGDASELVDEISAASVQQSEMILLVENGIKEISNVVQDNSTAAEKSASVSKELSQQARTLRGLISRFRI